MDVPLAPALEATPPPERLLPDPFSDQFWEPASQFGGTVDDAEQAWMFPQIAWDASAMPTMVPVFVPASAMMVPVFVPAPVVHADDEPTTMPAVPAPVSAEAASVSKPAVPDAPGAAVASSAQSSGRAVKASVPTKKGKAPEIPPLSCTFRADGRLCRCDWAVDGRKLRSNDKRAVSPVFSLVVGAARQCVPFKLILNAKTVNAGKGGGCFKKARGRGLVQLKCEDQPSPLLGPVKFRIVVGAEERGPIMHDFSYSAIAGFPNGRDEFDFNQVLNHDTMTFIVSVVVESDP